MPTTLTTLASESGIPLWLFAFIIVWTLVWKGIAWWKSARSGQVVWFVAFFLIHTMGILEILYIFLFSKISFKPVKPSQKILPNSKTKKPAKRKKR